MEMKQSGARSAPGDFGAIRGPKSIKQLIIVKGNSEGILWGYQGYYEAIKAYCEDIKGYYHAIEWRYDAIKGFCDGIKGYYEAIKGYCEGIKGYYDAIKGHFKAIKGYCEGIKRYHDAIDPLETWPLDIFWPKKSYGILGT